jgi:hypothetical protein
MPKIIHLVKDKVFHSGLSGIYLKDSETIPDKRE